MIKVVIVEDERLVRIGIAASVEWEKLGFTVGGQAEDGESGYNLILREKPEVVITDIKMPRMDGLEMIRRIQKELPETEFIVITSYNDFPLAQKALRLGVADYLIKSEIEPPLLEETLRRIVDKLDASKQKLVMGSGKSETGSDETRIELELRQSLSGVPAFTGYSERLYRIVSDIDYVAVCSFEQEFPPQNLPDERAGMIYRSLVAAMDDSLSGIGCRYIIQMNSNRFALLFCGPWKQEYDRAAARACRSLKNHFNLTAVIGISGKRTDSIALAEAYNQAVEASKMLFFHPGEIVGHILNDSREKELFPSEGEDEQVFALAKRLDFARLSEMVEKTLGKLNGRDDIDPVSVIEWSISVFTTVYRQSMLRSDSAVFSREAFKVYKEFSDKTEKVVSVSGLMELTSAFFADFTKIIPRKNDAASEIINNAVLYIQEHVTDKISLDKLSSEVGASRYYLSTIFNEKIGESLTNYINKKKMEKAMELLSKKYYSNSMLAELLGISDETYFSKLFKKHTGVSPKNFRSRNG
ncbi:MAG: response regulator [Spirochaetia bacterium]